MSFLGTALAQLKRHATFTGRYLMEYFLNCRIEAEHGLSEHGEWYLSETARVAHETYGRLLREALFNIEAEVGDYISRKDLRAYLKKEKKRLQRRLDNEQQWPDYLGLTSFINAKLELLTVLSEILSHKVYIPNSYLKWNRPRLNRWRHTPYIPDKEAYSGLVFWLNSQTKLVLFDGCMQVRWMEGRVLTSIPYEQITGLERVIGRRKYWRIRLVDGSEHLIDMTGITDLTGLEEELLSRCSGSSAPVNVVVCRAGTFRINPRP